MKTIAFFEIEKKEADYLKKKFKGQDVNLLFFKEPLQDCPVKEYKDADILSPFIYSTLDEKKLAACKKLKAVSTRSTGFDHIDQTYCKKKSVQVANVPSYGENTVAEHTFALLLNLSRHVHKSYIRTLQENYNIKDLVGFDLEGKTLGVFGTGKIGMHVIKIAKGFGMHVKAFDVRHDMFLSRLLHFDYCSVEDIIKNSDVISLHMPLNSHTYHFLDEEKLKMTKKGVVIINTSRGGLIETKALYNLLKSGHIAGAGLDVIEGEELIKNEEELLGKNLTQEQMQDVFRDKSLLLMENVIFTPHNAFNSQEAIERILDTTVQNIQAFLESGQISNRV
ncbi:hydroxyacid dehydrogenase [Candidatus Woesearchaeota archaeon]|nr:hydroxyacid dehydrogenase [Nanoarchaeota archaeon]MCB9370676.1 hydroxyacid dehydrogenase [Candidatus Woesearchaeota archaeon]USN43760.1 MAG: hydroxyacid dehydrogenase [Candidatus Woesearchaeota archaeon]